MKIEIDADSGFCFGVTTAIEKAEEELSLDGRLYCLGDIVHNGRECDRLREMGLEMIDHDTFGQLQHTKVLLRAHGEPPATYEQAKAQGITAWLTLTHEGGVAGAVALFEKNASGGD